jgi:hypothetical protein
VQDFKRRSRKRLIRSNPITEAERCLEEPCLNLTNARVDSDAINAASRDTGNECNTHQRRDCGNGSKRVQSMKCANG